MLTLPPQSPAVSRNTTVGALAGAGVQASQSACANLVGPAQSLCYAALYGVYV